MSSILTEEEILLSEKEVFDVLAFAKSMSPYYSNVYTPDIVNNRMKDINMNPIQGTQASIEQALLNPKDNEDNLIAYSQYFELGDMVYKRMLGYVGNLASFDLTFYPINADSKDLKSSKYKADYNTVLDFLDKFNHKREFKRVMRQLVRQESFYSVFREEGISYTLQELPQKYCEITQRWDYGLLFDFNMNWFLQTGIDIDSYPPIFKEMYMDFLESGHSTYKPASGLYDRDGQFAMWRQTSPVDGFFAWKFNPDIITEVPYFAPLFPDLAQKPLIRQLQKNIYVLQAQKVMVGLIPLLKDNMSGNATDNIAIKPETMGQFLGLLRQGLDESIKVGGVPFEDIKTLEFDGGDKNILEKYTQVTSAMSGTSSRLLFGVDKPNAYESEASMDIDEFLVTHLYPYFEDFLNFYVNRYTKKFKFAFKLEGSEFTRNREKRLERQIKLIDKGIVMKQKLASALGMGIKEFDMQLEMTKAEGFVDKLTPIISAYQLSGKDSEGEKGREKQEDLGDSGMNTREQGANKEKE